MKRLFIKENKLNNHRLTVQDETGKILYLIEGFWGRKNDIIRLSSLHGDPILKAKQANLSPFFKFDLYQKNQKIGTIRKHPGFFGLRDAFFTVHPQNWVIKGNFDNLRFSVFENEIEIAQVTKVLSSASYLFSVRMKKNEKLPLVSLLAVLLDHYARKKDKSEVAEELEQKDFNLGFMNYHSYQNFYFNKEKNLKKIRQSS